MRVSEIIRDILDIIDGVERPQPDDSVEEKAYSDDDIKRFRQIVDLINTGPVSTEPHEQYAGVDAVTVNAGADSWQGTKDAKDIRGTTTRIYGDN
jgi:hypothetical protein